MTLHVGDLVRVNDNIHRYKGRIGSVASVVRVNPRRRLVVVGERPALRTIKGAKQTISVPLTEEQSLAPVYEIGVGYTDPSKEGTLATQLWFKPEELATTGKRSKRTAAEKS